MVSSQRLSIDIPLFYEKDGIIIHSPGVEVQSTEHLFIKRIDHDQHQQSQRIRLPALNNSNNHQRKQQQQHHCGQQDEKRISRACHGSMYINPLIEMPILSSSRSGKTYVLLSTITPGGVGSSSGKEIEDIHWKPHVKLMLAAPLEKTRGQTKPEGASGYMGHTTTSQVLIKRIYKKWLATFTGSGYYLGELAAHQLLTQFSKEEHPYVVPLLESMEDDDFLYLITPYINGGELFDLIASRPSGLEEEEACRYFQQIVLGLRHLKQHHLAHGDLSIENIMIQHASDNDGEEEPQGGSSSSSNNSSASSSSSSYSSVCRLIDLEMARLMPSDEERNEGEDPATIIPTYYNCNHHQQQQQKRQTGAEKGAQQEHGKIVGGKPGTIAPECVDGTVVDWYAADIWSLGVSLYTILTGRPLYAEPNDYAFDLLCAGGAPGLLYHYEVTYGLYLPTSAADLICAMLRPSPSQRITLEEIHLHPWVKGGGEQGGSVTATTELAGSC